MYKFGRLYGLNIEHAITFAHKNTLNNDAISATKHVFIDEENLDNKQNDTKLFGNLKKVNGFTNSMNELPHGFKINIEQAISRLYKVTLNDDDKVNEINKEHVSYNEKLTNTKSVQNKETRFGLKPLYSNQSFRNAQNVDQDIIHNLKKTLNDDKVDEEEQARILYESFLKSQSKEKFDMMDQPNQMKKIDYFRDNPNVVKKHEQIDEKTLVELFILLLYQIIKIKANDCQKQKRQDFKNAIPLNKYKMALNSEQVINNFHKMTLNDDHLIDIST